MVSTDTARSVTDGVTISALGVRVHLLPTASLSPGISALVEEAWRDCRTADGDDDRDDRLERTLTLDEAQFDDVARGMSDLSTRVTLEALDALRGTRLLLHAAGVARDDGRTVALVGPSGRGKTTASRHLGGHFAYVSDETVCVDDDLSVRPYRKPLSVIVDGRTHKEQIAPSSYGLRELPDAPLQLVAVTLLERRPDATETGATAVDTIDAICEMTPQISYLSELPHPLQHLARLFDAIGAPTRLVYRDAVDLPPLIARLLDAAGDRASPWSLPAHATGRGPWSATTYQDAILVEGRACILREGTVTALDHRGRLVWTQCLAGASLDEMVATAIEEFGEPEGLDPRTSIEETLDDLRAHGLIEAS